MGASDHLALDRMEGYRYGPHEIRIRSAYEAKAQGSRDSPPRVARGATEPCEAAAGASYSSPVASPPPPSGREPSPNQQGFVFRRADTQNIPVTKQVIIDRLEDEERRARLKDRGASGGGSTAPPAATREDGLRSALEEAIGYDQAYKRKLWEEEETLQRLGVRGSPLERLREVEVPYRDNLPPPKAPTQLQLLPPPPPKQGRVRSSSPSLGEQIASRHSPPRQQRRGSPPSTLPEGGGFPGQRSTPDEAISGVRWQEGAPTWSDIRSDPGH